jgi:alpha-tubulin suppressor-like RCC1 family protein
MGVITTDHQLFMVGKGRDGQLGRAEHTESSASCRTLPRLVDFFFKRKVLEVACGGDHVLAQVK